MKRNNLLLISWILGAAYLGYLVVYFSGGIASTDGIEQVGSAIAIALVYPHLIAVAIAVIFNILGWLRNSRGFALTGAIAYTIAMVLFPLYFIFVIIETILSYIGASKLKQRDSSQVNI